MRKSFDKNLKKSYENRNKNLETKIIVNKEINAKNTQSCLLHQKKTKWFHSKAFSTKDNSLNHL